jgi:hypothetical protein
MNMTASQQPISASTSSYVKTKDDRLQSIQAVGGPAVEVAKVEDPFLYYSRRFTRVLSVSSKPALFRTPVQNRNSSCDM